MPSETCGGKSSVLSTTVALLTMIGLLTGCQTAHEPRPMPAALFGSDPDTQLDFWHSLAERKLTTNDAAFHGLLLYLDGTDPSKTYADRIQLLKSRQMLPAGFHEAADDAVTKGTLAVPLIKALKIKGGLTMRVFGTSPRYAVRELQYMGLYPVSSPNQTFSGTEFVGIIGKIDDYQDAETKPAPAGPPASPSDKL